MTSIQIKRVYAPVSKDDGFRILIDKLWPRGKKREEVMLNDWAKEITPSTKIRKIFAHKEENFSQFKVDYLNELNENPSSKEFVQKVNKELKKQDVTFLYGAKDPNINHAVILKEFVEKELD
ncbi:MULTISPECIES: DUF488 family protein [Vagococcus]|uniref:Uroporphyrin-III c-methyltransferase n=1 Tax=Vagococcus fluvialis bH819 TaxID=1255619 RepID=A0A1X6WKC4_9ENTE|nr:MULTISPECIES: DUF488 family protein [Vagococcus]SLM84690.1 protein of unknown function YeaO [Vagococcus fluvialis bH819]HCM89846.1 DUF488 domain-containing protein [Vagococcus sp.]